MASEAVRSVRVALPSCRSSLSEENELPSSDLQPGDSTTVREPSVPGASRPAQWEDQGGSLRGP